MAMKAGMTSPTTTHTALRRNVPVVCLAGLTSGSNSNAAGRYGLVLGRCHRPLRPQQDHIHLDNLNAPRAFVFSSGAGVGFGPLQGGR
jgi:hypothetical protein